MSLDIILGCMYSGKSTELHRRVSRFKAVGIRTLTLTSTLDTRSDCPNRIDTLREILHTEAYEHARVIAVDEAQFFPDLLEFVRETERDNKKIILAGLDGDYRRRPFGQILACIPLCDSVVKLTALDADGSEAIFTYRSTDTHSQIHTVNSDYIPVSRANYLLMGP